MSRAAVSSARSRLLRMYIVVAVEGHPSPQQPPVCQASSDKVGQGGGIGAYGSYEFPTYG